MNYLTLKNVSKSYGDKVLFRDVEFYINKGDKVALIARNGTGKTSLLRVIAGEEESDGDLAKRIIHPSVRIGYLKQEPELDEHLSVIDCVFSTNNEKLIAIRDYEAALARETASSDLQELVDRIEQLKAWETEAFVREILFKLQITDLDQIVGALSGGQKKRLALAKVLIDEPDFLILDEPTNHLDLNMIEWLENFLIAPGITLLLITHDRYFLDRICDSMYELEGQNLQKYSGNYSRYLEKKNIQEQVDQSRWEKTRKLMKTEYEWIRRQPKARTTKAKARIDRFEKIRDEVYSRSQKQELQLFLKPERLGSKILECQYINKSYGELELIQDFHYKFKRKDRIGVIGPNGSGKTTFLRLLTNEIEPDDGKVVIGETLKFGYYTQEGLVINEHLRIIEAVRSIAEYLPLEKGQKLTAETLLERFLFKRSQQQARISTLSGGERRRLHLLMILMQNPNFLILDEPTNDLDIHTLRVLEDYLLDFPGVLLIVSHDRFFMDKLVDHLFVFHGDGKVADFPGNYTDYRFSEAFTTGRSTAKSEKPRPQISEYEQNRMLKRKIRSLEQKIERLERRQQELNDLFLENAVEPLEAANLNKEYKDIRNQLEQHEEEWSMLVEKMT